MKRVLTVTLVAALALFAGSAYANFCARDVVPATTLLAPYVVVSMDSTGNNPDGNGYTTYLSVTNVSNEAQIIHVNVWSADSEGVLDFNQVLSGYDVWMIDFANLLNGNWSSFQTKIQKNTGTTLPFEWGPDGRSAYGFTTTAAPYGPGTATDDDWWTGLPLAEATNALPAAAISLCTMDDLTDATGAVFKGLVIDGLAAPLWARSHNGCGTGAAAQHVTRHLTDWLSGLGDNPLFFYVTVDLFNRCELAFPNSAGYFGQAGTAGGLVKYENLLIGEVYWVNMANGFSEATPAVHIESDTDAHLNTPAGTVPPNGLGTEFMWEKVTDIANTWGTYEEPLATAFGFRYFNDAPTVTSSVLLWKNATEFNTDDTVNDCGAYLYYAWDMDEHVITRGVVCPVSPCGGADIDPNEFPFEINVVGLNTNNFDLPATYGWMLIVMPPSYGTPYLDPTPDTALLNFEYYGWAGVRIEYSGFSAGLEAATMANAHCFNEQQLPILGINYNYTDGNHVPAWW